MSSVNLIHSTKSMATALVSTGRGGALLLDTRADGTLNRADTGSAAVTRSNQIAASQMLSNRARPCLWMRVQSAPSGEGSVITGASTGKLTAEGVTATREAVEAPAVEESVEGTPVPDIPKKAPGPEKIELVIDTLSNYELVKPIPVSIESLGDRIVVAEVPGLDISITGTSVGGALLQLKEHITTLYEGNRLKKTLDPERARQLKMLETYIGKARRNWF